MSAGRRPVRYIAGSNWMSLAWARREDVKTGMATFCVPPFGVTGGKTYE